MNKRFITMAEVQEQALKVVGQIEKRFGGRKDIKIYGVPRGGIASALAVAGQTSYIEVTDSLKETNAIVDDIYDSGMTAARWRLNGFDTRFFVLFDKREAPWKGQWLVMPWEVGEQDQSANDIVTRLLQYIGEDPLREGLRDTPRRVLSAWKEWATGYGQDPASVFKTFEDGAKGCDELVIVHNIPIVSKCEHHLADIIGMAHVGYIPNGKIIGLSKIPRLVEIFSRRLQVQERLTIQIADALVEHLKPVGVGVLIRAAHACMSTRGVKIHGSVTTTSAMRGALMDKGDARKEFMDLCAMAERQS